MTKTFRDNCDINIMQRASFSRCSNAFKNVLFHSFCTPMCASQLWCNFRKSCMQRLRVEYNFGCRALYNLPWKASVSTHQIQCNNTTFEALLWKNTCLFLERCGNPTTYGYVLWCSQIVCIRPILWTLQSHFTLWMSDWTLQCLLDWWRVMPQCIRILPRLDQFRNWRPTPQ